MCELNWDWEVDPGEDSVSFFFTGDDGEVLIAFVKGYDFDTQEQFAGFIRHLEDACEGKRQLELDLRFHTYLGGDQVGHDSGQIVFFGGAKASFESSGVTFTIPVEDFVHGNLILCDEADPLDLRAFRMMSRISPDSFSEFMKALDRLPTGPEGSVTCILRSRRKPTFRETELDVDQVAEVLKNGGVFYFRQLTVFIDMRAKDLKPHFKNAGIPIGDNVQNLPITSAEVIEKLIPYIDREVKYFKLVDFAGFVKEAMGLPLYEKPPRPEPSLD